MRRSYFDSKGINGSGGTALLSLLHISSLEVVSPYTVPHSQLASRLRKVGSRGKVVGETKQQGERKGSKKEVVSVSQVLLSFAVRHLI